MMSIARGLKLGMCSRKRKSNVLHLRKKKKKTAVDRRCTCSTGKNKSNDDHREKEKQLEKPERMKRKSEEEKELPTIKKGDIVNISDLLFTKDRDYLIKHNHKKVHATQLAGKFIVLHFMDLDPIIDGRVHFSANCMRETRCLMDIYNEIQPKGCLEVVFISVMDATVCGKDKNVFSTPEEQRFEEIFSIMPWPAIPFSDIKTRKHIENRFGGISYFRKVYLPASFVIDPAGVVLQCNADHLFLNYGASGFPFSDENINLLISEDKAAKEHPSITTLLASPQRNYVISNTGDQVAISDLEDKVVFLYFYEEDLSGSPLNDILPKLEMAYQELAKIDNNFEIVLIYVHDTFGTYEDTTEVSFRKKFRTMPWLALPFKDPNCKKLQRIFYYPEHLEGSGPDPRLVIVGPHGKYVEHFGAVILLKFGIAAYPFTRESAAKLEAEKAKKLKLEMFWRDPNALVGQKDGTNVRFSKLVGKRTILLFGENWLISSYVDFFRMLKARYLQMKGTNDEFEVIHIYKNKKSPYNEHVTDTPWLVHPSFADDSNEYNLQCSVFWSGYGLLAFDSDGRLLRRTICPSFEREDMDFPFHAGSLEEDAEIELEERFDLYLYSDDESPFNN